MSNPTLAVAKSETQHASPPAPPKPRFVGIDLIKTLAVFLVVCIHVFLYTGFYATPITEDFGKPQIALRWISYCCVPLFMITTGYLMKNKTLSKRYYLGLVRILVIYVVISVICVIFNIHHFHKEYTAWSFLRGMFNFNNAQYGWYVEYYISIFLLIPFLNLAYNGLKSQKQRLCLVLTVFMLSSLSMSFQIGLERTEVLEPFPGYFTRCYPFAYYFIGAYLRDYPPKQRLKAKLIALAVFAGTLLFTTLLTYSQSRGNTENKYAMLSWSFNDYGSWPMVVMSTCIFVLLFDITCKAKPVCMVLKVIGNATLGTYLISYVFDSIFHAKHSATYLDVPTRLAHAPEVIAKVFFCSLICGLAIHGLYDLGEWIVHRIFTPPAASEPPATTQDKSPNA